MKQELKTAWQETMDNSLKRLLNDIIGYTTKGSDIIVKTHSLTVSVRHVESLVSWIVLYKKKKLHLIGEIGETDIIFQSITSFISDVDKEINDADNS